MQPQIESFIRSRYPAAAARALGAHTPLFSSGLLDSFGVLELMTFLEDTFAVMIDPAQCELATFDTIAKMCALVVRLQTEQMGS